MKKKPFKHVKNWSPAHDKIMASSGVNDILKDVDPERRAVLEAKLKKYVSALVGVVGCMKTLKYEDD